MLLNYVLFVFILMFKQSRSILCKIFFEDVNNFCLYNPFRFSRGLIFLFSKYFNLYRLNYHKQSKIFYKRLLLKKNKFRHKKYFKKIRLFKKKILLFFSFRTYKQLSFFFNNIYFKKSIFLFNLLLNSFELRLDFLVYRLRYVFSLFDARLFIEKNGLLIDNEICYDFTKQVLMGCVITFLKKNALILYIKFYYFWFNEFIYSNKLRNLKLFNKIILLKKFKKKLNFFRIFFKEKLIFFKKNIVNFYLIRYDQQKNKKIYFLSILKKKLNKFILKSSEFLLKINNFIYLFIYFFIYNLYILLTTAVIFNLNFIHKIFKYSHSLRKSLTLSNITSFKFNNIEFFRLLNYFINFLNLKIFKLKYVSLKKLRIKNYINFFNGRSLSKSSLLILNKKKIFKFILLLKQLVSLKIKKFPQLAFLHKSEKHPKLQNLLKGFKRKIKFSFYRLKKIFSKKKRRLNLKFFLKFKRLKQVKFNLFNVGFNILYKLNNRVYRPRYLKKNKMHFFSFYKRVNQGFKYSFVDNRLAFREQLNKLTRLLSFKKLFKFSYSIFLNIFQYKLQTLFLKFRNRIKKKCFFIWKKRNFKLFFYKFFYLNKTTDFYNFLYRLKKRNLNFNKFKFLLKQVLLKISFFKLKKHFINNFNKCFNKKIFFFKSIQYLNSFVSRLQKRYKRFKKKRKIYLRFFFKKRFKFWDSGFKLNVSFLKKDLFLSNRHNVYKNYSFFNNNKFYKKNWFRYKDKQKFNISKTFNLKNKYNLNINKKRSFIKDKKQINLKKKNFIKNKFNFNGMHKKKIILKDKQIIKKKNLLKTKLNVNSNKNSVNKKRNFRNDKLTIKKKKISKLVLSNINNNKISLKRKNIFK